MTKDPVVIVGMSRTPMGAFQGDFSGVTAPALGSAAIRGAIADAGLQPADIEESIMGCVLPAGLGQAPARQAARGAGIPDAAGATTVNKMCGSGMRAAMYAHDALLAGSSHVLVAGGMESMTNAPYLLPKARGGYRLGHQVVQDHMFLDGLEDAYDKGRLMGSFAEDAAQHFQFSREAQDNFAISSLSRAQKAINDGLFRREITAVTVAGRGGSQDILIDEQPGKAKIDKIPTLKPAFSKDGTVTAANSSSISDGAAALVMMRESEANRRGLAPVARVLGHATHAAAPAWFTTAPVGAIQKLLDKVDWTKNDVDLFEINEAFAVVAMIAMKELDIAHDKINVHGGACALGHPIGASGARILVTLMAALQTHGLKRGVAGICIGGGEATAMAVELM